MHTYGNLLKQAWLYDKITWHNFLDLDKMIYKQYQTKTDDNGYAFVPFHDKNALISIYSSYCNNTDTLNMQGIMQTIDGSIHISKKDIALIHNIAVLNISDINALKEEYINSLFLSFVKDNTYYYYHKTYGFVVYDPNVFFDRLDDINPLVNTGNISSDEWNEFFNNDLEIRICSVFNYFDIPIIKYRIQYTINAGIMFNITEICNLTFKPDGLHIQSNRLNGEILIVALSSIGAIYPSYLKDKVI